MLLWAAGTVYHRQLGDNRGATLKTHKEWEKDRRRTRHYYANRTLTTHHSSARLVHPNSQVCSCSVALLVYTFLASGQRNAVPWQSSVHTPAVVKTTLSMVLGLSDIHWDLTHWAVYVNWDVFLRLLLITPCSFFDSTDRNVCWITRVEYLYDSDVF
jgi:hypothetical protein